MALSLQLALDIPPPLPLDLAQRIHDARYSGRLSDCAVAVLSLLVDLESGPRAGKENAVQISAMQRIWQRNGEYVWPDRTVKGAVKELIEDHEVPIGSSRITGQAGYFLLISVDDLEAAERPLRAEILSLAKRLRTINPSSRFARMIAGQLAIDGGAE